MSNKKPFSSKDLARELFLARTRCNLSLAELGHRIGCTAQQVHRWEHQGRVPTAITLRALAIALDCSADSLLRLDNHN